MADRSERQFVRMFSATEDWWAQRAAASGAATDADLPDVTFAHDGIGFAGEEKTTSEPYVYVEEEELRALRDYAAAYGMRAVIIGRFKGERAFYVWNPNDMGRTDAGTYRGDPKGDAWAVKIAEPDGAARGVYPEDLTSFALTHALAGKLGKGMVDAPSPDGVDESAGGETDGE